MLFLKWGQYTNESTYGLEKTAEGNNEVVVVDTFSYTNTAAIAGLGYTLNEILTVGASYTYYDKQLYTAHGQGGTIGISAHIELNDTDIFLKAKNLGNPSLNYNDGDPETLQADYGIALGQYLPLTEFFAARLMGQVNATEHLPTLCHAGLRLESFKKMLNLGVGYQQSRGIGEQVSGGLTCGLDLTISDITLSYAYQTTQYAANTQEHHFSVFFGF